MAFNMALSLTFTLSLSACSRLGLFFFKLHICSQNVLMQTFKAEMVIILFLFQHTSVYIIQCSLHVVIGIQPIKKEIWIWTHF